MRAVIEYSVPPGTLDQEILIKALKKVRFARIILKSLDARKTPLKVLYRVEVSSSPFVNSTLFDALSKNQNKKTAVVVGCGPAGYFCALTLSKAGFSVTILEQGTESAIRAKDIVLLEKNGIFNRRSNYCIGEGGAGTFSDGKLTSRTKGISVEKEAIFSTYIKAGAPEEIAFLSAPHIGSDILQKMMPLLRRSLLDEGTEINFGERVTGLEIRGGVCKTVMTEKRTLSPDFVFFAQGHSSHKTTELLLQNSVSFVPKTFALGMRAEHEQAWLNKRQWGSEALPGFKAADYRLTGGMEGAVYSFCMCPGGMIVPAASSEGQSIVNGMSFYDRGGEYCNAAVVTTVHPNDFFSTIATATDAVDLRKRLDEACFLLSNGFSMPACRIKDFVQKKKSMTLSPTSYPLGIFPHSFDGLYPEFILEKLRIGLTDFEKKLPGYSEGQLIGIEPTTSSPLQVVRGKDSVFCEGISNLAVIGEASGFAGGIVSSAVHGIKAAMELIRRESPNSVLGFSMP